jgi:spore germination cell wall hydrolase CwlJ-like protein
VGKNKAVKNNIFPIYYLVVISVLLITRSAVYINIFSKQKGQSLKKKTRIIWVLLGGALAVSGAIITLAGTSQSKEELSAQASLLNAIDIESRELVSGTYGQARAAKALLADVPADLPAPEATPMVLADVALMTLDGAPQYSQEEIYQFIDQGDFSFTKQGIHSHSEEGIYQYSEEEKFFMARVVYAEARGEIFEGQVAVATVIINRFESGEFGSSVKRVVLARSQFAVSSKYNDLAMSAVEAAIERRGDYPDNMFYFQASTRKTWRNFVYLERIGGHSFYCAAGK